MERKSVPHWTEFEDTVYGSGGVYRTSNWMFWPDLEVAHPSELELAIKVWSEHGYEPDPRWVDLLEWFENDGK